MQKFGKFLDWLSVAFAAPCLFSLLSVLMGRWNWDFGMVVTLGLGGVITPCLFWMKIKGDIPDARHYVAFYVAWNVTWFVTAFGASLVSIVIPFALYTLTVTVFVWSLTSLVAVPKILRSKRKFA